MARVQMVSNPRIHNVNVADQRVLLSPQQLRDAVPVSPSLHDFVADSQTIERIIDGQDARLIVVVGHCSIHDPTAALDYARRLKALQRSRRRFISRDARLL